MGCWHGHGHGCGPGYYWPVPRGSYPPEESEWFGDVNWPLRRRYRERASERTLRVDDLEMRLDELREEMRRIEAALVDLRRPAADEGTP